MKHFGTDGIRGIFGDDLNAKVIGALGNAIRTQGHKKIILGHDTRKSCGAIISALGLEVTNVGVVPTTALAYLTRELGADLGIMITASHNPPEYNGIKLFGPDGQKLDGMPLEVLDGLIDTLPPLDPVAQKAPKRGANRQWQNFVVNCFKKSFHGKKLPKVYLDNGNGSGWRTAEKVFKRLGFDAEAFNTQSDGNDINVGCGATHPEFLSEKMTQKKVPLLHGGVARRSRDGVVMSGVLGFSFDGDADRCVVFDENGTPVPGDVLLALLAEYINATTFVSTVMMNVGTEKWLRSKGIDVIRTPVGDRYVLAEMLKAGAQLGGEASGHIIFPKIFMGGDGLLTALVTLEMLVLGGKPMSQLAASVTVWPSLMHNVEHEVPEGEYMRDGCRVLVRKSGTERLYRILVEGEDEEQCRNILNELCINNP